MKKTLLLLALSATLAGLTAQEQTPATQPPEPPPEPAVQHPQQPRDPKNRPRQDGRDFVENTINRAQRTAQEILNRYDENRNGRLDSGEKKRFLTDMEEAEKIFRLAQNYRNSLKILDADEDLKISDEEKTKAAQRLREARNHRRPHHLTPEEKARKKTPPPPGENPPPPPDQLKTPAAAPAAPQTAREPGNEKK